MNWRETLPISVVIVIIAAGCVLLSAQYIFPSEPDEDQDVAIRDIEYITTNIETVMTAIADQTRSASGDLSSADSMESPEVQEVLNELLSGSDYTMSYAAINPGGIITAVAPDNYSGSVGVNISESEPGDSILRTQEPFLSDAFTAKEGFTGIEIAWPVFSKEGVYKGSILAMAEPSEFIGAIVSPIEEDKDITATVMQPDGFILYDQDEAQIGKNLFTDEPFTNYENLQMLGKTISANGAGMGEYTFYRSPDNTEELTKKDAYWDTFAYMGKEWRIILFTENTAE
ncbi:hypothetical protein [Methanogenium sp. MK-MG]|uniref:hypothetical protein n=1 Tax=Methanogenium sp. MK-MG TaxID=2599926 RepID=UPI0013EB785D|nr:hypothetical protein [Methanogenium sp. MK-MG]KAF1073201.1 hypothetical protein MKMG_02244 [Methanogenium sp. MK-MG]